MVSPPKSGRRPASWKGPGKYCYEAIAFLTVRIIRKGARQVRCIRPRKLRVLVRAVVEVPAYKVRGVPETQERLEEICHPPITCRRSRCCRGISPAAHGKVPGDISLDNMRPIDV